MKNTKIICLVCIILAVMFCLVGCGDNSYNAKNAKSVDITATLIHADGVLLQKIESKFTKSGKTYNFVTKTTSLNALDSGKADMYSTEEQSGANAKFAVPSFVDTDFVAIFEKTETKLYGKITAEKIATLGIADATSDVLVELQLNKTNIVSLSVSYTNAKGATVSIVAKMTY